MRAELRLTPADAAQPRAIGALRLTASHARGASQIAGLRQSGSLKLVFPRPVGVAGGAGAMAAVLYVGPDAAACLPRLRALLPPTAGASLIRDGTLFARLLAADGFDLRKALIPVIEYLSGVPLPKVWRL